MYLNIYAYGVRSLSCDVHNLWNDPFLYSPIFNNRYTIYFFFRLFLIIRTLKHLDLAAAFSTTLLTELEQNHSSGLVDDTDLSLFAEILKYFNFVEVFFPLIKHPKRYTDI